MRKFILAMSLFVTITTQAQHFDALHDLPLSNSITAAKIELSDFDNDGLLDVAIIATGNSSRYIQFIKGDTLNAPVILPADVLIDDFSSYSIVDFDDDNDLDFVFYGPQSAVYYNMGNFLFNKQLIALPAFKMTVWIDLNNDGQKEIVGNFLSSGNEVIKVFKRTGLTTWQTVGDGFQLSLSAIEILDADFDGIQDVFVSGRFDADSLYSGVLLNEGDFYLVPTSGKEWLGILSAGNLNEDGIFDIAFAGVDEQGNSINRLLLSSEGTDTNVLQLTMTSMVFIADFNSDGKTDINYLGKTGNDTLNLIQVAPNDYDTLPSSNLLIQQFGDVDRDGDLDVIQLTNPNSLHIAIFENKTEKNQGPSAPSGGIGLPVFDRFFLYWRTSTDDHTLTNSLTYDVVLDPVQTAEFDLLNERRLRTSHGNNLTQNFKLLEKLSSIPASFAIQSVDNSFTAFLGEGGICMGSTALNCSEVETETIQVCTNEEIKLSSPPDALWFSFNEGFLGIMNTLSFQAVETDTVFYFDPSVLGCQSLKAFTIEIRNTSKVDFFEKYVCNQQIIRLGVEENWEAVQWTSLLKGNLGSQDSVTYTASATDSIFVHLTNAEGCDLIRKTTIHISKPTVVVSETQVIIMKGQEVQLQASGAERYEWTPGNNLSNTIIPDPIASPIATITYTVTGYDSIGCTDQASVKIFVEDTGFVPNLFTPNNDGKNDELKIYGLNANATLNFSIYNREGKLVYQTQDPTEASNRGWDGNKNGVKQPAGVYFWKVSGSMGSGEQVLLNGKREGSIVLVR